MKKLDEGQKIILGVMIGIGAVIVATQIALHFWGNTKSPALVHSPAPAPAPSPAPAPGQV